MKDFFHIREVQPQELMQILLTHFSSSQNTSEFVYKYQKQNSSHYIVVDCNKNGSIKSISTSTDFPKQELSELEQKIKDALLSDQVEKVGYVVGLSDEKITGYFKYKDLFQIIPIPEESPKPPYSVADHAFILEVTYKKSSDFTIDNSRKKEKATIYSRLLNQLLNQHIWLGTRYTQSAWAYDNIEDLPNLTSKWTQLGYIAKGLKDNAGQFSNTDSLSPIELVDYNKYYAARGRSMEALTLPDNLDQSLDKVFSLSDKKWRKFFMACSWYSQYNHTWQESHSSSFIELVTALECLAQDKETCKECKQPLLENEDICKSCGQPLYRITKHFQEFLKEYVPNIDQYPKAKKTIYQIRSQLAHGMDLLQADLEPWNFIMDAKKDEQRQLQYELFYITRIAIYNWLQKA